MLSKLFFVGLLLAPARSLAQSAPPTPVTELPVVRSIPPSAEAILDLRSDGERLDIAVSGVGDAEDVGAEGSLVGNCTTPCTLHVASGDYFIVEGPVESYQRHPRILGRATVRAGRNAVLVTSDNPIRQGLGAALIVIGSLAIAVSGVLFAGGVYRRTEDEDASGWFLGAAVVALAGASLVPVGAWQVQEARGRLRGSWSGATLAASLTPGGVLAGVNVRF